MRYDFSVNRWEYILLLPISILALWFVLFIGYSNSLGGRFDGDNYIPMYIMGYFILGAFLNSKSYGALKNRLSAVSYLTLPASTFEKFFLHWFLRIALYTLLYPLVFYIGVNVFIPIFNTITKVYLDYYGIATSLPEISPFEFQLVTPNTGRAVGDLALYFGPIFTLTIIQLGSIAFGKWNLVKTFLVLTGLQILVYYYIKMIGAFKGGLEGLRPNFHNDGFPDHITMLDISLMALMVTTLLVCWTATFMKLKEREV
jgi:hypothetical protein